MDEKEKEIQDYYDSMLLCDMCNRFDGFCEDCPNRIENLIDDLGES